MIIAPLVIYPNKEARGNVVHPLLYFKLSPSINWKGVIRIIMNTQAINIGRQQLIGRFRLFTFEAWKKDILSHVHGHCNILCGGALLLCLCMDYFIFAYSLKIICLGSLPMLWKYVLLWFFVLCIFHLQFNISDDIGIFSISINSIIIIIIIINRIIWLFIWFFLKTLVIITKCVTSITNTQSLWLNKLVLDIYHSSTTKNKCSSNNPIVFILQFRMHQMVLVHIHLMWYNLSYLNVFSWKWIHAQITTVNITGALRFDVGVTPSHICHLFFSYQWSLWRILFQ